MVETRIYQEKIQRVDTKNNRRRRRKREGGGGERREEIRRSDLSFKVKVYVNSDGW